MANMIINTYDKKSTIDKNIYGHFSEHLGRCIYNGIFVGKDSKISNTNGIRNDIIQAFKDIKVPVLRWPGGCFADEYHWKDGIGTERKTIINTNWGGITENNSFGTHEFLELCQLIDCEPYISGNLGSGTIREMSEWVEYITSDNVSPMTDLRKINGRQKPWKLKYFGIGNENWGCGGSMSAEYYSNEYKRYQTFCRNYSGNTLFKIACGPNADDYSWTETIMKNASYNLDGISLHYYTIPTGDWSHKGDAIDFTKDEYNSTIKKTLKMDELITRHCEIMSKYDPQHRVKLIVDEWGTWYDVQKGTNPGFLYQQNTMRDAIVCGLNLNIFNNHSDRVSMTNIAQIVNVLQSVILTDGENLVKTPTYYVYKMFVPHHDATLVYSHLNINNPFINYSTSINSDGSILFTTIVNASLNETQTITINAVDFNFKNVTCEIINGEMNAYNDFKREESINLKEYSNFTMEDGKLNIQIPACSIVSIKMSK